LSAGRGGDRLGRAVMRHTKEPSLQTAFRGADHGHTLLRHWPDT
jgi:hypothetical protein